MTEKKRSGVHRPVITARNFDQLQRRRHARLGSVKTFANDTTSGELCFFKAEEYICSFRRGLKLPRKLFMRGFWVSGTRITTMNANKDDTCQ
ncbi:hypothetical protein AAMO2058_001250000 [Amorphochlora amoebiformis]